MVLLQVDGGALDIYNAALVLQSCTLTSNEAAANRKGGAVFLWKSTAKISACDVSRNLAGVSCNQAHLQHISYLGCGLAASRLGAACNAIILCMCCRTSKIGKRIAGLPMLWTV